MRFISMIRIEENTGQVPSEQLMSDMGKLIEELTSAGRLISTAGLRPTSEGVRVRLCCGTLSMTDGPFTETKEVIGWLCDPRGQVEGRGDRTGPALPEGAWG